MHQDSASLPVFALVAIDDADARARICAVLRGAGHGAVPCGGGMETIAQAAARAAPALLLLDRAGAAPVIAWLRKTAAPLGTIPVMAWDVENACPETQLGASRLLAAVEPWLAMPGRARAAIARLEAAFGRDTMTSMLWRLRAQLDAALGDPSGGDQAHRLAGIAGTLGFTETGAAWRRVSEGDRAGEDHAVLLTRATIAMIDREYPHDPEG